MSGSSRMKGTDMLRFAIDEAKCTQCGLCVLDCPSQIIEARDGGVPSIRPESEERCIRCQHCLAICPSGAVSILGRDPADSLPLAADERPALAQAIRWIRGRRSVRQYRNENVSPELLSELLDALRDVPSGVNRRALTISVIDDKEAMGRFRAKTLDALAEAARAGRVPERYAYLTQAIPAWYDRGVDVIFRGAPHLLAVSASPEAACPQEDVILALAQFEFLAQSAGLGTVWCGMAKMALEILPDLKRELDLPPRHFYYAMLFGPPAVRYARSVQRDPLRVHRVRI